MKKKVSVEDALIAGLKDAREYEHGKKKLKTTSRELPGPAPEYSNAKIRQIRHRLGFTQEEFAIVLNVAVATLRAWEQGVRRPEKASNRLLEIIVNRPQVISELKGA